MCTHINIVVHDGDLVENSGEARHVGHGISIGTGVRSEIDSSRKVKVLASGVCTYFLEEAKQVVRIRAGIFVATVVG
jgi:hypothetical protein